MGVVQKPIIAVAMSGGVDSSVTAALLQQQGHPVIGITMRLFEPHKEGAGTAAHDAAIVARHLNIPHHIVDFSPDFNDLIIKDFIEEYSCGHTPNPCVRCNRFIKFGFLLEKAKELGAEFLATGHYVKKTTDPDGTCHLRTARYIRKDQSYFLYTLNQDRLKHVLFPLGEVESKDDVRRMAREFGLPVAEKGDSQEVCFIPNDDYISFLESSNVLVSSPGEIVHINGKVLGRHQGTHRFTIGQRKGLGIAWSEPLYVVEINKAQGSVVVAEEPYGFAKGLIAGDVVWINEPEIKEFTAKCKIRYRHQPTDCDVRFLENKVCEVRFHQMQKAVTPGQAVVFYQEDEVLGGGRILSAIKES